MRSFRLPAVLVGALIAAGCGGDGGNGPSNNPPTAGFTESCTQLSCTFDNTSTDDGTFTSSWEFGDPAAGTSDVAEPTYAYAAAGTYTVTLTVTDDDGATDEFSKSVTVSGTATNNPPNAAFTVQCISLDCTFTNTSIDIDGTFTSSWNFGDGSPVSTEPNPVHHYDITELTPFTVTLTVTDDDGATSTETNDITVSPPASLTCGSTPDCSLVIDVPSRVVVTLVSSDCELPGNTFNVTITPPGGGTPVQETLFTDGCDQTENPPGTQFELENNGVIAAGTEITAQIVSGGVTLEIPPAIRVTGSFATGWTLEFDDGAKAGPPPEPDFNDLIISVVATPE